MITLEPNEKIVLVVHKHWFVYLADGFFLIFLVFAPFLANRFFDLPSFIISSGDRFFLFIFFSSLWLLAVWLIFFFIWTYLYLDAWIITDKRVIDIEQIGLFARDISSFRLEKIQDITVEVHGILATTLGYGTIHIQTAGEVRELSLNFVPRPEAVKATIDQLMSRAMEQYINTATIP